MRMSIKILDELVEIVGQRPYRASNYLAAILNCWTTIIKHEVYMDTPQHVPGMIEKV